MFMKFNMSTNLTEVIEILGLVDSHIDWLKQECRVLQEPP